MEEKNCRNKWIISDITEKVQKIAQESSGERLLLLSTESAEEAVFCGRRDAAETLSDIEEDMRRILPPRLDYQPCAEPWTEAGRSSASLIGESKLLYVRDGKLMIPADEAVYHICFTEGGGKAVHIKLI